MAQPGNFTPILLYGSSTPGNVPLAANLTNSATGSEIALNVADKNLFFKDSGGVVNTVPIRQSSTSSNGWLSSTDWNTFNNKSNTNGTVTSVAALTIGTTGTDLSSTVANGTTTPVITLQVPTASATNRGALSSTDWSTFNNKYSVGGALGTPSSGTVTNLTGTASININGTVGATTPATGAFTTITASSTIKGATTISVGNATPSASGAGITFPATQSASTDANTLDDYEEGTFTVTASTNSGVIGTWVASTGTYTKIGRLVYWQVDFTGTNIGLTQAVGYYLWSGLPFTPFAGSSGSWTSGIVYNPVAGAILMTTGGSFWLYASGSSTVGSVISASGVYES